MAEPSAQVPGFYVRFWGVRGSIPTPGAATMRYGGNTSCVEVGCGEHLLIFDAGTGLREFGNTLLKDGRSTADIFLTHTHFDHICGLPFFAPIYCKGYHFQLWAGHLRPQHTLRQVLREMMMAPLFPIPPEFFGANVDYVDFLAGATLQPRPGVVVRTAVLNHPNRATGYRIEHAGKAVCYITDIEHTDGHHDAALHDLVQGADIMIYDATYTDAEYPDHRGWGHSTWREGAKLADAAKVGTYVIFHHDPSHDDAFMDRVAAEAAEARPGTVVAREGMVLRP